LEFVLPQPTSKNSSKDLTSCALIDSINGKLQRCGSTSDLQPLATLVGMWQLDTDTVDKAGSNLENIGVCYRHFLYDQNQLHKNNAKQKIDIKESLFQQRRCLFCGQNVYFFSRGSFCNEHAVSLYTKNILVPCIGCKSCSALQINQPVAPAELKQTSRYICCSCYENHGGHIHRREGRGKKASNNDTDKHDNDNKTSLQLIVKWLINLSNSDDNLLKSIVLKNITLAIGQSFNFTTNSFNESSTTSYPINKDDTNSSSSLISDNNQVNILVKSPSLFAIKTFFNLQKNKFGR